MQSPPWPFMLTHESLCSHQSCWPASHTLPFPPRRVESVTPQLHLDSHSRLELPEAAVVQTCCMAFLAWLGSARLGRVTAVLAGLALCPWSCAAASVCFVDCLKLVFLCTEGFCGYLVVWLGSEEVSARGIAV